MEINKIFKSLALEDPSDPPIRNRKLSIWGRTLLVPESTSKVAKFNFEELCGQPLSAADYLEVTKNFATVFLLNVPKMGLDQKDLVRCSSLKQFGILITLKNAGKEIHHLH